MPSSEEADIFKAKIGIKKHSVSIKKSLDFKE